MAEQDARSVAALTARNPAGHTRIHLACKNGQLRSLPAEVLTSAYLTLRNDAGYTPLHQATQQGHAPIIGILLEAGASPNALTNVSLKFVCF